MYHDIVQAGAEDASGFPGRDAALYKLTPELFEAHLCALARFDSGSTSANSGNLSNPSNLEHFSNPSNPPPPALTFDDGGTSALVAADALERHGLVGFFFVTTDYIGTRGFVSPSDIRDLRRRGHAVGSHSCSHPLRMGHCAWTHLVDEWTRSRRRLEDVLGEAVRVASVPGGDFAPRVAAAAALAGIATLFTSEPTRAVREASGVTVAGRYTIRRSTDARIVAALAGGAWLPHAQQTIAWSARKITKRIAGGGYLRLRERLLGGGREVRWGDMR